ncbi:hypothetical protein EVA_05537 [gut metagenome]|uniref:Uncharacterized protein n=1 Tax=gut metagenome TaxID=749906 RepID=J9GH56_9ZZZZ
MSQTPENRSNRNIKQSKVLAQQIRLFFQAIGTDHQMVTKTLSGQFSRFFRRIPAFQESNIREQLTIKNVLEKASASTELGIRRHQLRMGESFIDVGINHISVIQNQITLDQNRNFTIRVLIADICRLIHVNRHYLEITSLFI